MNTSTPPRRSAIELSQLLAEPFAPTPEQAEVIEAPLQPALVIAGAGSGKTTTMADRVAWLVSEQGIRPDQILGLTFTRKATQELSAKIHQKLKKLRTLHPNPDEDNRYAAPVISTYNSFANTIFRDNALLVGREPESELLTEAAAWTLAKDIVYEHGGDELVDSPYVPSTIIDAVLNLSRESVQHGVPIGELEEFFETFENDMLEIFGPEEEKDTIAKIAYTTPKILPLVRIYLEEKRRRNLVEYSDQVALAYEIVRKGEPNPVKELLRDQYRVVLLDEYQDTTVSETRLLSAIFDNHPVMAVGDPYQSIYGWRGASANNLGAFRKDFHVPANNRDYTLSVSWRNDHLILEAANLIAGPLKQATNVPVETLSARPGAGPGNIVGNVYETSDDEAESVAEWFASHIEHATEEPETMAILVRKNKALTAFAEALHKRGIPYEISSMGGLVHTPEVADTISALRVIADPYAGPALIRLLTGGRWRIGLPDLKQLKYLARQLGRLDENMQEIPAEIIDKANSSGSLDSGYTIIDALDYIDAVKDSPLLSRFSDAGKKQLKEAAASFARLRRLTGHISILELIQAVIEELRLDIELYANELRATTGNLAKFRQEVANYLKASQDSNLKPFLQWVDYVSSQDSIKQEEAPAAPGRVQLLSMHAAKGLEWDIVALPQMNHDEFPSTWNTGQGWLYFGALPYPLRADDSQLPNFEWENAATAKELDENKKQFAEDNKRHNLLEERRLAYVAITRAKKHLMLSAVKWKSTGPKEKKLGIFFTELGKAGIIEPPTLEEFSDTNPAIDNEERIHWPTSPLGVRETKVQKAATYYYRYRTEHVELPEALQQELDLLKKEYSQEQTVTPVTPQLPHRIPASQFRDFIEAPEKQLKRLTRPMPQKPYRATRLGTEFHEYIEKQALKKGAQELFDSSWFERDEDEETAYLLWDSTQTYDAQENTDPGTAQETAAPTLESLKRNFDQSEWGGLQPLSVEEEIQLPLAGKIVICKIDAVYTAPAQSGYRVQVVDWKTGKAPQNEAEKQGRLLQIHLYRLAYAEMHNIPLHEVDAALYYVASDEVIRSETIVTREDLEQIWNSVWG